MPSKTTINWLFNDIWCYLFSNKAKERIPKWVFQENKARQIFQKMNISYSPDTHLRELFCVMSQQHWNRFDEILLLVLK